MCGIFAYIGSSNAVTEVFDGLKALEYRGYDSWGIASIIGQGIKVEKHVGKISQMGAKLQESTIALGHTRWATHGGVTTANAHPHLSCDGAIALVHNGIIENYLELKKELDKSHKISSQTDTEIALHLIEEEMQTLSFQEAVIRVFHRLKGFNTLVAMHKDGTFVAARCGSPLVMGRMVDGALLVSSDLPSLLNKTQNIAVIQDGGHVVIDNYKLSTQMRFTPVIMENQQTTKSGYSHFMAKEIADQPSALLALATSKQSSLSKTKTILRRASNIYLTGCGTAFYAMACSAYSIAKTLSKAVMPIVASELPKFVETMNQQSVVVVASQSGETIDTIQAIRMCKKQGATVIALVNVPGSTIAREADIAILLHAGVERAVVSTKAFVNMIAALYIVLGNTITIKQVSNLLSHDLETRSLSDLERIARRIDISKHVFIVARGNLYPIALEGALKLKESCYLHAEGMAAGELKHGALALIVPGSPCLILCADGEDRVDTLSTALELKARGAYIIGIGPNQSFEFDDWLLTSDGKEYAQLTTVLALQQLAYTLAVMRGIDPDMPRNLAKSVTVK